MGLFSRKSKSKAEPASQPAAAEDKPAAQPYRHVPTHAAADASRHGSTTNLEDTRDRIYAASQQRIKNSQFDSALGNAAYTQSIARSNVHGVPSPTLSIHSGSHRKSWSASSRSIAHEIFMTDPDAPPMPASSGYHTPRSRHASRPNSIMRGGSDYFTGAVPVISSSPSSPVLGPVKPSALRAPTITNPHHSSDSGYESNGHSRAPSEHASEEGNTKNYLPKAENSSLPDVSLSDDVLHDAVFRDHAMADDGSTDLDLPSSQRPIDPPAEVRITRRSSSTSKKTRFEEPRVTSRPASLYAPKQWNAAVASDVAAHAGSIPVPHPDLVAVFQSRQPTSQHPAHRASTSLTSSAASSNNGPSVSPPSSNNGEEVDTPRAPFDHHVAAFALPSTSIVTTNKRQRRESTSLPPLSILDGLKVNRRGVLLDEEGDMIGELIEGDLLDCVRQKANAFGEVLDESGAVVGTVRTVLRQAAPPEAMRPSSSSSMSHRLRGSEGAIQINTTKYAAHRQSQSCSHILQPQPEQPHRLGGPATWFEPAMVPSVDSEVPQPVEYTDEELAAADMHRPAASPVLERSSLRASGVENTIEYAGRLVQPDSPRRAVARPIAERTLSDLTKSYARPSMTSVPEGAVAEEERVSNTPGIYSYKGEIPPEPTATHIALLRSKSPAPSIASRKSYSGTATPSMSGSLAKSAPTSNPSSRRATQIYGAGHTLAPLKPALAGRHASYHSPLKRSPLSSHEVTPNGSDEGDFDVDTDDVRPPMPPLPSSMRHRSHSQASVRTAFTAPMHSSGDPPSTARHYFTHNGQPAKPVGPANATTGRPTTAGSLAASIAAESPVTTALPVQVTSGVSAKGKGKSMVAVTIVEKPVKKSRFSFGLRRKSTAVAAH